MCAGDGDEKKSFLFKRLIINFHTVGMQQLGKIADPVSGNIMRDLEQVALTIDTLDMLQEKCSGNLSADEALFLSHVISELKLNYVDEIGRLDQQSEEGEEKNTKQQTDQAESNSSTA